MNKKSKPPESPVEMSALDAVALGVGTGDQVKVSSASNAQGIVVKVLVTQGLKPGVVAKASHYGNWEQHPRSIVIEGKIALHNPSRDAESEMKRTITVDEIYGCASVQDPVGARCSFYDAWV